MSYTFTQGELDQITIALADAQLADDTQLGKYGDVYDVIYEIVTNEGFFNTPVAGLEDNVWTWIAGAAQVNRGAGYSAYFIREYTREQYKNRYGLELTDEALNIASNTIANNFIQDILTGTTPSIDQLGLIDAAPVAGEIFDEYFNSNYTPWSGSLLFPFLGIDSHFNDWLLNEDTVADFKPLAGTYDLVAAAAAAIPLAGSAYTVTVNFISTFGLGGAFNAAAKADELSESTNTFFDEIYQTATYNLSVNLGEDLFSTGGKTANYIVGTLGDDTYSKNPLENKAINGTADNDVIQAGLGDDVVFGGDGDDLIDGDQGDDTIDAGRGNNIIVGGQGADKIILGEGESVILDGSAEDRLYVRASLVGGALVEGEDRLLPLLGGILSTVITRNSSGGIIVDKSAITDTDNDGNNEYWFSSHLLTTLSTGGGSHAILGDNLYEKYNLSPFAIAYEMDGSDLIIRFYKNYEVLTEITGRSGGTAADLFPFLIPTIEVTLPSYQPGDFGIVLEGPNEIVTIVIDGLSEAHAGAITTHNNFVALATNSGNLDELLGPQTARQEVDNETGQPEVVAITTGQEDDEFVGDETDEKIDGEAGDDQLDGAGGDDEIDGGTGNDEITGGSGDDTLSGGPGDDVFMAGSGSDSMNGGSGIDYVDYSSSLSAININLGDNTASGGDATGDTLSSIEGIIATNQDDVLLGSSNNDIFIGNAGDDILSGNAGDDLLDGGIGADIIDGGDGLDIVSYKSSNTGVTVDLTNQLATGGNATGDLLSNIEGIIGSDQTDTLIGDDFGNIIRAGAGDDVIFAAAGDDIIEGGAGADNLNAGSGNDTLNYGSSNAGVTIDLSQNTTSGGHATGDQISGFENLKGSSYADQLQGDAQVNIIEGGEGDDTIIASGGGDIISGGMGSDTLVFSASIAAVTVDLTTRSYADGLAAGIEAISIENLVGSDFNDQLTGDAVANSLSGGVGDDNLTGAGGDDLLDGGDGINDTVYYEGNQTDYKITLAANGALQIEDQRANGPEGTDTIVNIEYVSFNDGVVAVNNLTLENATPIAADDQAQVIAEGQTITITSASLLANDTDHDGDTFTITNVINGPKGQVELLPNGDIEFTPDSFFNGTTYFEYEVSDGISSPAIARVTIEITPFDNTPFAQDDSSLNIYSDQPTIISQQTLLANDVEFDGEDLQIISVSTLAGGTPTLTVEGDILFTPTDNAGQAASFIYVISDPAGNTSQAYVQTVMQVSLAYDAQNDSFLGNENQPQTITLADLFANDVNSSTQTPSQVVVTNETNGTVSFNVAGDLVFTPDADFFGTASFTYEADNREGGTDTANVTITIAEDLSNTTPIANDDAGLTTFEDQPILITASQLLANDSDPESGTITISTVSSALNGTVSLDANGDVLFTPGANYNGPASFTYTISDGNGGTDTAIVNLTVIAVNNAPIIANAITDQNSDEDAVWSFTVPANTFSDVDGDTLILTATLSNDTALPSWLSFDAGSRAFTGTPPEDFNGSLDLKVTATDSSLQVSDEFTVTINPINDAPVATDDGSITTNEDTAITIAASTLLANDNDVDGDTLTITAVGTAVNGTVVLDSNGDAVFTPDASYNGPASFIYTTSDGNGGTDTATVNLTIAPATTPVNLIQDIAGLTQYINGTTAIDAFVIDGNASDYGWDETGDSEGIVVWSGADFDILYDVEQIRFNDGTVEQAPDDTFSFISNSAPQTTFNIINDLTLQDESISGSNQPDIFAIDGLSADYGWGETNDSLGIVVWNDNNFDILNSVEQIEFTDGVVTQLEDDSFVFASNSEILTPNGTSSNDTLTGGNANDILSGLSGDDTLTGGIGLDLFVASTSNGADIISDFEDGYDLIDFADLSATINDLSDLTISQVGSDALVSFAGGSFTLTNIQVNELTFNDFIFS